MTQRLLLLTSVVAWGLSAQSLAVLTREEAERMALENNPRIHVSKLLEEVQGQTVRESRAGELPSLTGKVTGVEANQGTRVGAGTLSASRLLTHAGAGAEFSQLITDFGRTRNLVAAEKLKEKAREADVAASREDIILATDQVFYQALEAQATLQIADQTAATRQTLVDQITALTNSKLKSTLDLSFAQVDLSRAKLLQLEARNNIASAKAALTAVLGFDREMSYELKEDGSDLPSLPPDANSLITTALQQRPDLRALHFSEESAQRFSRAQREQLLPTVSAIGTVGATPVGSSQYFGGGWFGAVGVNITIPLFEGFRYQAQAAEAALEVQAAGEQTRERRNSVVRDVETAWLNANTALQRVSVAAELLKQSNTSIDLAQTRYQLGLSSIVELSQAQLQQTEAAIEDANARAAYRLAISALRFQVGGAF